MPPYENNPKEIAIRTGGAQVIPSSTHLNAEITRSTYVDLGEAERLGADSPSAGLLEYWRILQRHKGRVILIASLGGIAGFLYTLPQTPVYQARTVIEIQEMNEDFLHMKDVNPTSSSSANWDPMIDLQTQVQILQSRALLDRVIAKLDRENKPLVIGETRMDAWRKALGLKLPQGPTKREIAGRAAGGLRVRAQTNTRLIEIFCDSTSPQVAAEFANTIASEFIEQNLEARWKTTEHTGEWLARQMADLKIRLEKAEGEMQSYARKTGLTFTQEKDNVAEQKLKQLQDELSKAQGERIARQSRYELATRAPVDSLGEILDDAALQGVQSKLTDLGRQLAELSSTYTPSHPNVKKVQAQMRALEGDLRRERANILGRIRNDFESAERREKLLAADYATSARLVNEQANQVSHYNILKREVDSYRQLYDSMLQRVKEAGIASALRASNIRVMDPAVAPATPYKPIILNYAILGMLSGMFAGICFVIFVERADRKIQDPGDLNTYAGVNELGIVPSAGGVLGRTVHLPIAREHVAANVEPLAWASVPHATSAMAESFRAMLTSILYSGRNGPAPHVLVVSSAAPHEGKTILTTNLAVAFAEIHKRVLLIDGDLRRPQIHRIFGLNNDIGLADLLRQTEPILAQLNRHLRSTAVPNLWVMTSGPCEEGDTTRLHSQRLKQMMKLVRQEFDVILIDTPPMLMMADARVIARHADGVILVARSNHTLRDSIRDAHQRFNKDGTYVLGAVLNDWNPKRSARYGYADYYERYKHYYTGTQSESVAFDKSGEEAAGNNMADRTEHDPAPALKPKRGRPCKCIERGITCKHGKAVSPDS